MSTLVNTQKEIKNLKTFSTAAERFEGSHLLCPGCAHSIIVREVLNATNDNLVVSASTGCLEVVQLFILILLGIVLGFILDLKTHQQQWLGLKQ